MKRCPKCHVQCFLLLRGEEERDGGTGVSGRAPLLWTQLPLMLSQCLGRSFLRTKRRYTEREDAEKGMLGYAEDHSASGNVTELER